MTETPFSQANEPESERSGSADPDPNATSRLPPIRPHDERLGSAGDATTVSPTPAGPTSSAFGAPSGSTDQTTRLPPAEYTPVASYDAPAPRYQAPTSDPLADDDDDDARTARRGPGTAAALGIAGLTAAAMGLYALPLQQESGRSEVLFGQLRSAAAFDRVASITGSHSTSLAGGQIATSFWRYGGLGIIGGLAFLLILAFAWAPLRLAGGILTFLGAAGALVYLGLAARETNKFETAVVSFRANRMAWSDWKIGFWIAVGGLAVAAFSGLWAVASRRR